MLIVVEGLEGSGKSTLATSLAAALQLEYPNRNIVQTRTPGGTELGQTIRRLVLDNQGNPPSPETLTLLLAADFNHWVEYVIKPSLKKGDIVIADRWGFSASVYQGYGMGVSTRWISQVYAPLLSSAGDIDLIFWLYLPPDMVADRLESRGTKSDVIEQLGLDFFERVADGYSKSFETDKEDDPCVCIDATGTPEFVLATALSHVREKIGEHSDFFIEKIATAQLSSLSDRDLVLLRESPLVFKTGSEMDGFLLWVSPEDSDDYSCYSDQLQVLVSSVRKKDILWLKFIV